MKAIFTSIFRHLKKCLPNYFFFLFFKSNMDQLSKICAYVLMVHYQIYSQYVHSRLYIIEYNFNYK